MKGAQLDTARVPVATYRLQFNETFRFADATALIPYLHALGISDIYASPYLKARKGSKHGYDIIDHNLLNPEVGSREEYAGMTAALRANAMGQILDIVPNHMCVASSDNSWWQDLLENGPSSPYSGFFDIDWTPAKQAMRNRVLLPILGDQYGTVLENGELQLAFGDGAFTLWYYEHRFPIMPRTYSHLLSHRLDELEQELGSGHPHYHELLSIMTALEHLPIYTEQEPDLVAERYREKEVIKRRLAKLCAESDQVSMFILANVRIFNGEKGAPASFDLLDRLLRKQIYRLAYWRVATEEINYRRFFDINDLGAIRVEKAAVFTAAHRLVFDLIRQGEVTGLRVDHADGLYNPSEYLGRLQAESFVHTRLGRDENSLPVEQEQLLRERYARQYEKLRGADPGFRPFYVICEKILARAERLPADWPVFGATGYSFANDLNGIFVATENARAFEKIYRRFIRAAQTFPDTVYEKKKLVMEVAMSSEINTLGHYLDTIADINRHTLDFTRQSLVKALVEVIAFFPVYRTYTADFTVSERDRQYVEFAVSRAKRKNPAMSAAVFDFIRDVLLLQLPDSIEGEDRCWWLDFTMRFQQITGPVMAKGAEDTAFYLYNRLISLNEVGGAPERFGLSLAAFHELNRERQLSSPHAMLATSTHDTKRSEDVRARINVLSEMPLAWREVLGRWSRLNRRHKRLVEGQLAPDRNEEYLLYQTLVGAWPMGGVEDPGYAPFRQRIREYMLKALREAKVNTSWITPHPAWEEAVDQFVSDILKKGRGNRFLAEMERFQAATSACGMCNSLSQTLLKITVPGVPDFYQGNELWNFSLVDPDNRRPVDFRLRMRLLEELKRAAASTPLTELARELVATRTDGRIKLFLTNTALRFRRDHHALFASGEYRPLAVAGVRSDHVCAFERSHGDSSVIVAVPRFCGRLLPQNSGLPLGQEVWQDTRIILKSDATARGYRNLFTGELLEIEEHEGGGILSLRKVLSLFPVALLHRVDPAGEAGPRGR